MGQFSYLLQLMKMTQETESEGDTGRPRVNHAVTDNLTTNTSTDCTVQTATSNIATAETEANSDTLTQGVQSAVTGQSKPAFASSFSLKGIFLLSKNNLVVTVLVIFYYFLVIVLYTLTKT